MYIPRPFIYIFSFLSLLTLLIFLYNSTYIIFLLYKEIKVIYVELYSDINKIYIDNNKEIYTDITLKPYYKTYYVFDIHDGKELLFAIYSHTEIIIIKLLLMIFFFILCELFNVFLSIIILEELRRRKYIDDYYIHYVKYIEYND